MALIHHTAANTPLILLQYVSQRGRVFVKLESMNPSGSIKDRVALQFVRELKCRDDFSRSMTIVTASSGNIGVSFAMVCAVEQIKLIVVMPANMSIERRLLIYQYGASLVLTDPARGLLGAMQRAASISQRRCNCILFDQFSSLIPFCAHELYTAPELVKQCNSIGLKPKYFASGIGTGATLCGCAAVLSRAFPGIQIVGVETRTYMIQAQDSWNVNALCLENADNAGQDAYNGADQHQITGICPGMISTNYNKKLVHKFINISEKQAIYYTKLLARKEGIIAGPSSGANIAAAVYLADRENCDVITIIVDAGERYLSVQGIYDDLADESSAH